MRLPTPRLPQSVFVVVALTTALAIVTPVRATETMLLPPALGQYLPEGTVAVVAIPSFANTAADVRSVVSLFDEETAAGMDLQAMMESRMPGLWSVVDDESPAVLAFAMGSNGPGVPGMTVIAHLADRTLSEAEIGATVKLPMVQIHDDWVVMSADTTYTAASTPSNLLDDLPAGDIAVRIDLEPIVAAFGPMLRAMMSMGMASASADTTNDFDMAPESQRSLVDILGEVLDSARSLDLAVGYDGDDLEVLVSFGTLEGSVLSPPTQPDFGRAMALSRLLPAGHEMHVVSAVDFENVVDLYREGLAVVQGMAAGGAEEEIFELYSTYLEELLDSTAVLFSPQALSFGFDSGAPEVAYVVESDEVGDVVRTWADILEVVAAETEMVGIERTDLDLRPGWTMERIDVDLDFSGLADPDDPDAAVVMNVIQALVPRIYLGHRDGVGALFATSNSEHFLGLVDRIDDPTGLEIPAALKAAQTWAGGDVQQLSTVEFRALLDSAFDLVRAFIDIPLEDAPSARVDFATLVSENNYTQRMRMDIEDASHLILELIEVFEKMDSSTEEPEPELEEARLNPPPGESPVLDSQRAAEMAARLRSRVEELRGHEFLREVPVQVVDDATAQRHFVQRLSDELPEDMLDTHGRVYVDLGLMDSTVGLETSLLSLLEEQAGGYYDPDSEALYLLDDMPPETAPAIMVHELTHALDDQIYDLDGKMSASQENNDRMSAFGCVTEGSGMAVMSAWMTQAIMSGELEADALTALAESEAGQAERLAEAPRVLSNALLVPYLAGPRFLLRGNMLAMVSGADPADVDHAFENPPVSMEQVLHPEKYWEEAERDLPRAVTLPDLSSEAGKGWAESTQGTLGELDLATLTGLRIEVDDAAAMMAGRFSTEAAEGWDGDRFSLLEKGDLSLTVLAVVFDSDADAEEFVAALDLPEGSVVEREGALVVAVCGDAPDRAAPLVRAALAGVEVGED